MKSGHVPSIVRLTVLGPTTNTKITGAKQYTASTDAELGKKLANGGGVVAWDRLLVVSIRGRDGLGNCLLVGEVLQPIEVRFVCVICWIVSEMKDLAGSQTYLE